LLQLTGVALQRRGCHYRSGWRKGRRSWVVDADTGPAGRATIVSTEVARGLLVGRNSDASGQGVEADEAEPVWSLRSLTLFDGREDERVMF
jgi:hypothetical protein